MQYYFHSCVVVVFEWVIESDSPPLAHRMNKACRRKAACGRPSLLSPKVSRMYFLIMAAHDPITNEEFSSILFLSLPLSLGNIELLLKGIQTQT